MYMYSGTKDAACVNRNLQYVQNAVVETTKS